ncbi:MAG: hypothetical protein M1832_005974 [Thelocarpon impressellum]|nr:MAG: hypothetical protein M1832_005974 [Thelocarpon impressellum]
MPQLNPFEANQGFDIIPSQECLLRFQNPGKTQDYNNQMDFRSALRAALVTVSRWETTPEQVKETVDNYEGSFGTNAMLWLGGHVEPYQYAGVLKGGFVEPQAGLAAPATVVTYLLPQGAEKVKQVNAPANSGENAERVKNAGGRGISGTVDPTRDYAYAPLFRVARGLAARYPGAKDPLFTDKSDDNCIVIDFRSLPSYTLNKEGYPTVEACDFVPGR